MDDPFREEYLSVIHDLEINPSRRVMSQLYKMVEQEYPPAIYTFSYCLDKGIGVEKNEEHAFQYCKVAAELGNCAALNNMGCNYLEGRFVPRDSELALRYFSSAAHNGFVAAMRNSAYVVDMGIGVPADGELALRRYKWAYENGDLKSANQMGIYYICGRHVVPDAGIAKEWFQKGAAKGDPFALKNLEKLIELQRDNVLKDFSVFRKFANIWLGGGIS